MSYMYTYYLNKKVDSDSISIIQVLYKYQVAHLIIVID